MKSLMESFLTKFSKTEACWLWRGAKASQGYGLIKGRRKRKWKYAHRTSWELFRGEIPEGMHVLHRCDVPLCVNPYHLFLGTQADNVADMDSKGKRVSVPGLRGESNPNVKMSRQQVDSIRRIYEEIGLSQTHLATLFFVSQSNISNICRKATW